MLRITSDHIYYLHAVPKTLQQQLLSPLKTLQRVIPQLDEAQVESSELHDMSVSRSEQQSRSDVGSHAVFAVTRQNGSRN
jgi:hypothetical protein